MKVVFNANIEESGLGGWIIRLTNLQTKEEIICPNMEEFSSIMQFIGTTYKNEVEVKWSKADNLTEEHFFDVRKEMSKINKELNRA